MGGDGRLAGLYGSVARELRAYHSQYPAGPLRLHFIHRNGVMHQLVEDAVVGWTADFEEVASGRAS